jgi:hypothetical protein
MEPPSSTDSAALKDVRDVIFKNLQQWTGSSSSQSRAERLAQETKVEQTVEKKSEPVRARRAPEFETEICWDCGVPKNEVNSC